MTNTCVFLVHSRRGSSWLPLTLVWQPAAPPPPRRLAAHTPAAGRAHTAAPSPWKQTECHEASTKAISQLADAGDDEDSGCVCVWGEEGYLLGGARDQALVQPLGLLLGETLGLVVPHQSSLDLDKRRIR